MSNTNGLRYWLALLFITLALLVWGFSWRSRARQAESAVLEYVRNGITVKRAERLLCALALQEPWPRALELEGATCTCSLDLDSRPKVNCRAAEPPAPPKSIAI